MVVFLAVMSVVVISFVLSRNSAQKELDSNVEQYAMVTQSAVRDRLNVFEETLRAGLGLFAGNGTVSKEQFNQFISTSAVLERYAGAQSVAYAKVVPNSELDSFVQTMRTMVQPNFAIKPTGSRSQYVPVIYIEPQSTSNMNVVGFDISSEATRLKAITSARDTGQVTISNVVQSLVDNSPDGRAFVMYAPQYKQNEVIDTAEQRKQAIEGYVYASFRVNRFMDNLIAENKQRTDTISYGLSIGDSKEILYKANNFDAIKNRSHGVLVSDLNVGNTTFHFTFVYDKADVLPQTSSRPLAILAFGTVSALLIAIAVWLILRGKANELLLEQERGINEAKDNLLSLASHQLRTPATGVKQYLGLLIQGFAGDLTQTQQDLLEKAYAGNERQLKTINDVLYLARLGSGRIILSKSAFPISRLASDIARELTEEASARNHTLKVVVPKHKRTFYGDEHMIRMAIENLITNAIKYTKDGGTIVLSVKLGKQLVISVTDNGVGIEKSQQDRLFQQFERIDNDLSIAVGGSGIGLYVVRNIANLHEGHVEVTSELEKGSTFTIVLPTKSPE